MGNDERLTAKQFQQAGGVEDWRVPGRTGRADPHVDPTGAQVHTDIYDPRRLNLPIFFQ